MNILRVKGTAWLAYNGNKGILIDTGLKRNTRTILRKIKKIGIDVPIIFLTHTHYDHAGGAEDIRSTLGAKVVVGEKEAECLRNGHTPVPKGTLKITKWIGRAGHDIDAKHREYYSPVKQDIIQITEPQSLEEFGINGTAIPLGGHSAGSIGLKIDEHFFSGDNVFGILGAIYPIFADYEDEIKDAWKIILDSGAKKIYPGHGHIVTGETLKRRYNARYGRNKKEQSGD